MENVSIIDWVFIGFFGQYLLMLPLTYFFDVNRDTYRFSRWQWRLYWLPFGPYVFQLYLIIKWILKK